jgi:hypothetical protein
MECRERTWLALAGLAMLCLACAPAVLADQGEAKGSVGMEAYGVDPAAVLGNRWGMDVRDGFNRPVSRARLERDLKAASAQAAAQGSITSSLPHAKAAILLWELLPLIEDCLRAVLPSFALSAPAGPVPKPPKLLLALLAACGLSLSASVVRPPRPAAAPVICKSPAILRC